jgi:adenylate cyclase
MAQGSFKRKLAAVFSADVVGYSRLMGEDEAATVRVLETYKGVMSELIRQHRGRVVDSPGDNLLAEFPSVVDAVQCAVAAQNEFKARNTELPENRRMQFRIGINLGDVIEEGERIYGDGVNIAARLEALADPGGVCVSKTAFDHIETKLPLGYQFLGEQTVKNIARPVGAYKVLMEPRVLMEVEARKEEPPRHKASGARGRPWLLGALVAVAVLVGAAAAWQFALAPKRVEKADPGKMAYPLPDRPSIAVLAFTNMSGDPKDDLFGDGLAEGMINGLSKSEHLFVIARNSSFTYKGKPVKVKQVAEEMGVRYVIEGSVQREGERVRITVQLIDALTGHHLFSERYDRDLKNILSLQDEITMKVMAAVQVKLTMGESARIFAKGTKNLDAYLKVLEGSELKATIQNKGRVERSMQLCEEAIALDPEFAIAYSMLSTAHVQLVILGASDSPKESLRLAVELGKKAVDLDESNPNVHSSLTFPYMFLGELDKAIQEAEKGVSLSPNSASGYFALGSALYGAGRPKEAIPIFQKCLRLSPVPVHSNVLFGLANSYVAIGQNEEAIATYKRVFEIFGPDHLYAHLGLASTYMEMGHEKEARAEGAEVLRIDPKFSVERYVKNRPIDPAAKDRLAELLRKAGLK